MAGSPGHTGVWDVVFGFLPIVLLIVLTFRGYGTSTTLPLSTVALYLTSMIWFKFEPNYVNATVIDGLGDSLTTIAIVFGAICLFESLKMTKVLDWLTGTLRSFSRGNSVAEVMLLAWAFAYLIEGCSGFGTPTALAAPLLVEIGYDAKKTVICCLIMNTLATPFGAAGTPIWFGLDGLGIDDDNLETIGFWSSVISGTAAHVVPAVAALQLVTWADLKREWKTYFVCVYSCAGVALAVSAFSYELPTLLGGGVGLVVSAFYVKTTNTPPMKMLKEITDSIRSIGSIRRTNSSAGGPGDKDKDDDIELQQHATSSLSPSSSSMRADEEEKSVAGEDDDDGHFDGDGFDDDAKAKKDLVDVELSEDMASAEKKEKKKEKKEKQPKQPQIPKGPTWKYVMPLGLVVFFLTLTRFPELDLKDELKATNPRDTVRLGSFGEVWISSALVIGLSNIFREPTVATTFEVLYVPAFLPFFWVSIITLVTFGQWREIPTLMSRTWKRTNSVLLPIASALVLAALMKAGVAAAIANPIITSFGKYGWTFVTPLFGVLGSFFSGSTTVSNLTFGSVQTIAADRLNLNRLHLLALQTVGATIGNCICLQNIIQAKAVVGLDALESEFIKVTWKAAALFIAVAWGWALILLATSGRY